MGHSIISICSMLYSRFLTNPQMEHMIVAKNMLHYLKRSLDYRLFYPKNDSGSLLTYTDANWVGDLHNRRSTLGMCYKFGNSPIAWSNKLQPTIALSSIEAEYIALSEATCNITYLYRLLIELGLDPQNPIPILHNNINSIRIVKNSFMHVQTKYFTIQQHYVCVESERWNYCCQLYSFQRTISKSTHKSSPDEKISS